MSRAYARNRKQLHRRGAAVRLLVLLTAATVVACSAFNGSGSGDNDGTDASSVVPTTDASDATTHVDATVTVDAGVDVDAKDATADAPITDASDEDGTPLPRIVFVTSRFYGLSDFNSPQTADDLCNLVAHKGSAAGVMTGTFRAWLSSSTSSPSTRFTQSTGPYVDTLGNLFASSYASLVALGPVMALQYDENGAKAMAAEVWTGTLGDGTTAASALTPASDTTCFDWAITTDHAVIGSTNQTGTDWTKHGSSECDGTTSLFCFEQ